MQDILDKNVAAPLFQITIGGVNAPWKLLQSVTHISVNQVLNNPCSFSITVTDMDFSLTDGYAPILAEGRPLEISMGYAGKTKKMIEGEISSLSAHLDEGGGFIIKAEGFDALHRASRGTKFRTLTGNKDDSQIIHEIAKDMHCSASVEQTVMRKLPRYQNHLPDLQFLHELAENNGFSFWVDAENKQLCFKIRRKSAHVTVSRRSNLISFSAHLSTAGQVQKVEVTGYSPATRELISGTTSIDTSFEFCKNLSKDALSQIKGQAAKPSKKVIYAESGIDSLAEANSRAEGELSRLQKNLFTVSGSCIGNPEIQPGSVMTVTGMGSRFSKDYIVKEATHAIDQNGYITSFNLELS